MCSPPIYNSEIRIEFNNNLDKLNLLIIEAEKLLKKKYKYKINRKSHG